MPFEKPSLCLNTDDPEQKELFEFITKLPNGKKRNASAFLRTLVDREYQKRKNEYLAEKQKETQEASQRTDRGGIKYLPNKNINKDSDSSTNGTAD
jgi:DNA-directed RNA polymerase beta' subunit